LGNVSAGRGDLQTAEKSFRRVLQLDPVDLTALSNLGTLLAKEGKLKEATPLLRSAFENNKDIPGLAMNLARVECSAGDGSAARDTLKTAMIYCPDLEDMQRLLSRMTSCGASSEK
jgi:Flp pilus assembly protein TadD